MMERGDIGGVVDVGEMSGVGRAVRPGNGGRGLGALEGCWG
ncbi:hypothetical protein AB0M95_28145 [Sphaerisporangium sp. NPDC051017]